MHAHLKALTELLHVPPLRHGLLRHVSMSAIRHHDNMETQTKHVETVNERRLNRWNNLSPNIGVILINKYAEGRERRGWEKEKYGERGGKGEGWAK